MTAQLLSEVCHNIEVEPPLQPTNWRKIPYRTANVEDNARLDVMAQGFCGSDRQCAYFDVKVFNPQAPTNCTPTIAASYRRQEKENRRAYEKRVIEVEHASFTPIVLSSGGMGRSAKTLTNFLTISTNFYNVLHLIYFIKQTFYIISYVTGSVHVCQLL